MPLSRKSDVIVKYGADDSVFRRVTKRVGNSVQELSGFMGRVGAAIGGFFSRSVVGAIAGVGTAFLAASKSAFEFGDRIEKAAAKLPFTAEQLQQLRYAGESSGLSIDQVDTALQRFSRRVGEAQVGTGVLLKELERYNIPLRDMDGNLRSVESILYDYADAMAGAETEQEKLRLAVQAFDIEGAQMRLVIEGGSEAMRQQMQEASRLGTVLDNEAVAAAARFNQKWSDLSNKWATTWRATVIDMWELLEELSGTYSTMESAQEALAENEQRLEKARKQAASSNRIQAVAAEMRIENLEAENKEIRDQISALNDLEEAKNKQLVVDDKTISTETKADKKGKLPEEDWRVKSPEQIGAALDAFRRGEIDATELGKRAGLQEPDLELRPGAYGTASNVAEGAIFGSQEELQQHLIEAANAFSTEMQRQLIEAAQAFGKEMDTAVAQIRITPIQAQLVDSPVAAGENVEMEAIRLGERVNVADRTY